MKDGGVTVESVEWIVYCGGCRVWGEESREESLAVMYKDNSIKRD